VGNDKVPREIPGANDQERRQRYVDVLAAQVRLSFPTRVVAQMVLSGETPVRSRSGGGVHEFLVKNQGKFEIGLQPVKQYIGRNNLQVAPEVLKEHLQFLDDGTRGYLCQTAVGGMVAVGDRLVLV